MNKEKLKKLTIQDLIARADQKKQDKKAVKQLSVESLGGKITIVKPDRKMVLDAMDMEEQQGDLYLIYNCVIEPNLKDKELQKVYGVTNPLDIGDEIFEPGEVAGISKEIVKFAGYGDSVKVVDDIKN